MYLIKSVEKTRFIYKGIHYLDLMARNIQKGGTICDLTVVDKENSLYVSIKTTYAEGLTTTIEELMYENGFLIDWDLKTHSTSHNIFSRDIFNNYIINE